MDQRMKALEEKRALLEKEYHDAMERYRQELLKLDHEIVELSKTLSRSGEGTPMPEEGWNAEHEGVVRNDRQEGQHLFEF